MYVFPPEPPALRDPPRETGSPLPLGRFCFCRPGIWRTIRSLRGPGSSACDLFDFAAQSAARADPGHRRSWRQSGRRDPALDKLSRAGGPHAASRTTARIPGEVSFRVTVPADTPPGLYGVRVATNQGISPLRTAAGRRSGRRRPTPGNTTPAAAQHVSLPAAIDGDRSSR